ncbi:hypothetical protein D9M69_515990 [compost metagenome]
MGPGVGVHAVVVPAVGVDGDLIEDLAAEELVYRQIRGLALDIPQRLLNSADTGEDDGATALGPEGMVVHLGEELLNAERVFTDDEALTEVLDHPCCCSRTQSVGDGSFANAGDAFVGGELDDDRLDVTALDQEDLCRSNFHVEYSVVPQLTH